MTGAPDRLRDHVHALEGERHPSRSPRAVEAAFRYCEHAFQACGLETARRAFRFRGERHENLVALCPGRASDAPRVLVGAHVDTVAGSPGADDNASGVAGVLEVARALTAGGDEAWRPRAAVELAVFTLEERQGLTYRVGSRRFVQDVHARGMAYEGALILEMIGYRTDETASQRVPVPIRWMDIPRTGDFLACVGDGRSRGLVRSFVEAAGDAAPDLPVFPLAVPVRGWLVPATRRSDNASFWSAGYPAVMLTDTADLRNPHYHRRSDRSHTLDYDFMADVVGATAETVRRLAG